MQGNETEWIERKPVFHCEDSESCSPLLPRAPVYISNC
jgi:hypothetical protein